MLKESLLVGDTIVDVHDEEWTITALDNGIAYYDKATHEYYRDKTSRLVDSSFIAVFNENGRGKLTYNHSMTLVEPVFVTSEMIDLLKEQISNHIETCKHNGFGLNGDRQTKLEAKLVVMEKRLQEQS